MKVIETALPGVLIIEPKVCSAISRGFFIETFQVERYREAGITRPFVQDNHSAARRAAMLRGLHYQRRAAPGQAGRVSRGAVYDVAVDITRSSPTFGQCVGVELCDDNHRQMWIPPGYAHGFCVPARRPTSSTSVPTRTSPRTRGGPLGRSGRGHHVAAGRWRRRNCRPDAARIASDAAPAAGQGRMSMRVLITGARWPGRP